MFFKVGALIALSILNSGPGPSFLAPCVAQYLFYGMESLEMTPPNIEDVPDSIIKGRINQVRIIYFCGFLNSNIEWVES